MILSAYQHYRAFIEGVYPELLTQGRILTLDHPARVTELVQAVDKSAAVQLFVPQLIDSSGTFKVWRARVMVLAPSVNDALILTDKLTTALVNDVRNPKPEREPRAESQSGPGYGVITVSYIFSKRP